MSRCALHTVAAPVAVIMSAVIIEAAKAVDCEEENALLMSCCDATIVPLHAPPPPASPPRPDTSDTHLRAFLSRGAFSSWVTLGVQKKIETAGMKKTDVARRQKASLSEF